MKTISLSTSVNDPLLHFRIECLSLHHHKWYEGCNKNNHCAHETKGLSVEDEDIHRQTNTEDEYIQDTPCPATIMIYLVLHREGNKILLDKVTSKAHETYTPLANACHIDVVVTEYVIFEAIIFKLWHISNTCILQINYCLTPSGLVFLPTLFSASH